MRNFEHPAAPSMEDDSGYLAAMDRRDIAESRYMGAVTRLDEEILNECAPYSRDYRVTEYAYLMYTRSLNI